VGLAVAGGRGQDGTRSHIVTHRRTADRDFRRLRGLAQAIPERKVQGGIAELIHIPPVCCRVVLVHELLHCGAGRIEELEGVRRRAAAPHDIDRLAIHDICPEERSDQRRARKVGGGATDGVISMGAHAATQPKGARPAVVTATACMAETLTVRGMQRRGD
jgi:hypothetical protein